MNKGKKPGEKRELPGTKSAELLKLRNQYVPRGVFQIAPIFIEKGKGAIVEDVDGHEYIDFSAGISPCYFNSVFYSFSAAVGQ
jgi:4-aminobutyrate aminotransferase-like enzyme